MSFTKCNYYVRQQFLSIISAFFLIFLVEPADAQNSAFVVHSTHATRLIVHYLQSNPETEISFQNTKNNAHKTVTDFNQNLVLQKRGDINFNKPASPILIQAFPVISNLLTPGKINENHINIVLPHPIFIIGYDDFSISWLKRYEKILLKLNAVGFIVNVASENDFSQLKNRFPALSLLAIPGDSIAKNMHISHYPVLISDKLIEQ